MTSFAKLLVLGAIVRVIVMLYSVYHDRVFRVKYTDIDYMIITDGAAEMVRGGTPFDRATFRYTPLLSALMIPNVLWLHAGKSVFAMCDIGAAYFCYRTLVTFSNPQSAKWAVSAFILFNPIVINVSTRGNSDMVVAFLSLVALSAFFERRYLVSALWLGFAIHFKLYPVIYILPFVFGLIQDRVERCKGEAFLIAGLRSIPRLLMCAAGLCVAFAVPTMLCYYMYGWTYLYEAVLYHFIREDHRHNMSPYWMLMYLNQSRRSLGVGVDYAPGLIAFIPQCIALVFVAFRLRRNVAHAVCVQTVVFIAFNKVCTVQYFVWFLPFLPFIFAKQSRGTSSVSIAKAATVVTLWAMTIPIWVFAAYPVEFLGRNDFILLWGASCLFFIATVLLAAWLGRVAYRMQETATKRNTE